VRLEYFNPVKILFENLNSKKMSDISGKGKRRLIFCYGGFKETPELSAFTKDSKNDYIYGEIEKNPSLDSIDRALKFAREIKPEVIIAIGGGSVIDTAKVVRFGCHSDIFDSSELIALSKNSDLSTVKKPVFIAIPTTHGTGSELTMWATVWDKKNKKKHSISNKDNYPDFAVYDFGLFYSIPLEVSISSTLDALSHSFEAIWNINSNPVSDRFAYESIRLIAENIGKLSRITPKAVRKELVLSSMYAGLAFSNTKTAAAHSISYPLTLEYGIPHGIACSMPLFPLLKINGSKIKDKLYELFKCTNLNTPEELEERIKRSIANRVNFSLRDYGVKEKDLINLAEKSFTKERMANNIVELTNKDVFEILKSIY